MVVLETGRGRGVAYTNYATASFRISRCISKNAFEKNLCNYPWVQRLSMTSVYWACQRFPHTHSNWIEGEWQWAGIRALSPHRAGFLFWYQTHPPSVFFDSISFQHHWVPCLLLFPISLVFLLWFSRDFSSNDKVCLCILYKNSVIYELKTLLKNHFAWLKFYSFNATIIQFWFEHNWWWFTI